MFYSQKSDLKPTETPWHCVKTGIDIHRPNNLRNLERIYLEEWVKIIPKAYQNVPHYTKSCYSSTKWFCRVLV